MARPFRRPGSVGRLRFAVAASLVLAGAGAIAGIRGGWRGRAEDLPGAPPAISALPAVPPPATASGPPALSALEPTPAARSAPRARARERDPRVELQLLDQAQEAVTAGRFEAALALLEAHARRFPNGALVEERDALLIRTLSSLGRSSEAREAGAVFRRRFPRSVLGNRVDEPAAAE
jgi:TolA-binding protein